MPQVACPKRSKVLNVPQAALGKKAKCPHPECGHVFKLPQSRTTPVTRAAAKVTAEPDAFALAEPDPALMPKVERAESSPHTQPLGFHEPDGAAVRSKGNSAASAKGWIGFEARMDFEVLMREGRVVKMSYEALRDALSKGTIDRFTLVRPIDDLHRDPESAYGFVRKRARVEPWQSVGSCDAAEMPGTRTLYRSKIYSHDAIMQIVGTGIFVVLAVVVLYKIFSLEVDSQTVRDAIAEESGGDWRIRLMRAGVLVFPQGWVFLRAIAR